LAYQRQLERLTEEELAQKKRRKSEQVMASYHALSPGEKKRRNRRVYAKFQLKMAGSSPAQKKEHAAKRREVFQRWYYKNHRDNVQRQRVRRELLPEKSKKDRRAKARDRSAIYRSTRTEAEKRAMVRYQTEYNRQRAARDPIFKAMGVIRVRINQAIRRRGLHRPKYRTEKFLGCSWQAFMEHIERLFEPGMKWENWGRKSWHIDHIVPLAAFDLCEPAECMVACHFLNHRPLWASKNIVKAAAMPSPKAVPAALRKMLLGLDSQFFCRSTYRRRLPRQ
jgi:hypothetical protein